MMDITPEMIEAVHAHEAAVRKAQEKADRDERFRKYKEWCDRVDREHKERLLTVFPDITEAQIDLLHDAFRIYYEEMEQ